MDALDCVIPFKRFCGLSQINSDCDCMRLMNVKTQFSIRGVRNELCLKDCVVTM